MQLVIKELLLLLLVPFHSLCLGKAVIEEYPGAYGGYEYTFDFKTNKHRFRPLGQEYMAPTGQPHKFTQQPKKDEAVMIGHPSAYQRYEEESSKTVNHVAQSTKSQAGASQIVTSGPGGAPVHVADLNAVYKELSKPAASKVELYETPCPDCEDEQSVDIVKKVKQPPKPKPVVPSKKEVKCDSKKTACPPSSTESSGAYIKVVTRTTTKKKNVEYTTKPVPSQVKITSPKPGINNKVTASEKGTKDRDKVIEDNTDYCDFEDCEDEDGTGKDDVVIIKPTKPTPTKVKSPSPHPGNKDPADPDYCDTEDCDYEDDTGIDDVVIIKPTKATPAKVKSPSPHPGNKKDPADPDYCDSEDCEEEDGIEEDDVVIIRPARSTKKPSPKPDIKTDKVTEKGCDSKEHEKDGEDGIYYNEHGVDSDVVIIKPVQSVKKVQECPKGAKNCKEHEKQKHDKVKTKIEYDDSYSEAGDDEPFDYAEIEKVEKAKANSPSRIEKDETRLRELPNPNPIPNDADEVNSEKDEMNPRTRIPFQSSNLWSLVFNPGAKEHKLKPCLTRSNESGLCMYVNQCSVPNIASSLEQLLNNACVVDEFFIGVCCPEFPVETVKVQWEESGDKFDKNSDDEFDQESDCGKRSAEGSSQSWPWRAQLVSMSNGRIFCGGVLIDREFILTAAHCTTKIPKNQILVRLGQHDDSAGEDFVVTEIKRHAQYNSRNLHNDIALLKLGRRVQPTGDVSWVCLPDVEVNSESGDKARLLGWKGKLGQNQRTEELKILSESECQEKMTTNVPQSMLCTEARNEDQITCNADSGAPLVVEDNDRFKVIGILSWNRNDCDKRFPSVFSRVSSFVKWIRRHAN